MKEYNRIPATPNKGALDFSFLADAPAGKHGFLQTTDDGHFVFEDGARVRFFGVNLVGGGALCDKEVADAIAEDLYRSGVNMARFHHIDTASPTWDRSILDGSGHNSQTPSAENFDRLDYLVSRLKARGIYFHIDLHTLRHYYPADGFTEEEIGQLHYPVKSIHFYDRRVIELQKRFIKQYLEHYNPYTGLRYIDDPSVAIVQYVNENSIFWDQGDEYPTLFYRQLDEQWNAWLLKKYGTREGLDAAWTRGDGERALTSLEDPAKGTVCRPPLGEWAERKILWTTNYKGPEGAARFADHMEFLAETERGVFREIKAYMRDLGIKCVINLSTLPNGPADLRCVSDGDVTEHNSYWNHPVGGFRLPVSFHNMDMCAIDPRSQARNFAAHCPASLSRGVVSGKPFVVTEWNCVSQTRFRADALLQMAAYGAMQDWDGILLFEYTGEPTNKLMTQRGIFSFFDSCADPAIWGFYGVASMIFRMGLVDKARNVIDICYSPEDWKAGPPDYGALYADTMFVSRVKSRFLDGSYDGGADIALASGHVAAGDYRGAKRALIHSDNPYSDSTQKTRGRDQWYAMHEEPGMEDILVDNMEIKLGANRAIAKTPDAMGALAHVGHDVIQAVMRGWGLLEKGQGWEDGSVTSDTSQITFAFERGAFMVNAPCVRIFAGKPGKTEWGGSLRLENVKAGFVLASLDNRPIESSGHMVISAMGECVNSGARRVGDVLVDSGGPPVLYDDVRGIFRLETVNRELIAYGLSECGERLDKAPVTRVQGGFDVRLGGFAHYELILS